MATATYKRFDAKHGISVNGLPFVDQNRNVIVNDLTVQGVSTIIDTRTITSVDPIITLGGSGSLYVAESIITGTPGRIKFTAEAFSDIAVGDAIKYETGVGGVAPTGLTSGTTYYVVSREPDVTNANYRTITISETKGGTAVNISTTGSGTQNFTLNPIRDLDQDLGVAFNYVDTTPKVGFFGYKDTTGNFTFLLDAVYGGSDSESDDSSPAFTGTKGGIEIKYVKLEPTSALTSNAPAIDIDQTWNSSGTTFKTIEVDIVDTASDANSSLLDIAVGGSQKLFLRKDGALAVNTSSVDAALTISQGSIAEDTLIKGSATWDASGTTFYGIDVAITDTAYAAGSKLIRLDAGTGQSFSVDITGEIDTVQTWNSSGTTFTGIDLQVTETAFAAGSKLVNFYASSSRYFSVDAYGKIDNEVEFTGGTLQTAARIDVTDTSSAADSLLLDLQVGGVSKFSVDKDGDVIAAGNVTIDGSASFEDYIDIQAQPNGSGTYEDNTRFQTSLVTIVAGSNTATTINTFDKTQYVTGKYLIQIKQGTNYHSAEVLLIHDGSGAFMTEYAAVWNTAIIGNLDAAVSGNDVNLTLTPTAAAVAANAEIQVRITRISIAD
jgi:hypothetical protein